jgi:hypothetical protein
MLTALQIIKARVAGEQNELVPVPPQIPNGKQESEEIRVNNTLSMWTLRNKNTVVYQYLVELNKHVQIEIDTDQQRVIQSVSIPQALRDSLIKQIKSHLPKGEKLSMQMIENVIEAVNKKSVVARVGTENPSEFDYSDLPKKLIISAFGQRIEFPLTAFKSKQIMSYSARVTFHDVPMICFFNLFEAGTGRYRMIHAVSRLLRRDNGVSVDKSVAFKNKSKTRETITWHVGYVFEKLFPQLLRIEHHFMTDAILSATKTAKRLGLQVHGALGANEPAIELEYRGIIICVRGRSFNTAQQSLRMLWVIAQPGLTEAIASGDTRFDATTHDRMQIIDLFKREFENTVKTAMKAVDKFMDANA